VLKKMSSELVPGMVLAQTVTCPQTQTMLLKAGCILTAAMISLFKEREIYPVWVAEQDTLLIDPLDSIGTEVKEKLLNKIAVFAPERSEANTSDKMVEVARKVKKFACKIAADEAVLKICMEMKLINNERLYQHAISTSATAMLVAGAIGLGETHLEVIGTAGLLHDLGCCEMPVVVTRDKRSLAEEGLWKEHPKYGCYIAKEKFFREEVCELILHHQELWNGSGYPAGLKGEQIPIGSRIINVCGTYDRLIHQERYPGYQAIEYLYGTGGIYADPLVVNAVCDNLAVYPLGSLVRLSSDEVGVVANIRKNKGPRPIVRVFFNKFNKPYAVPREIDLGKERTIFIKDVL